MGTQPNADSGLSAEEQADVNADTGYNPQQTTVVGQGELSSARDEGNTRSPGNSATSDMGPSGGGSTDPGP